MIGRVSESLRNLLQGEMSPVPHVTLLSPADTSGHQSRVNLFCYQVAANPQLRNRGPLPKPGTPTAVVGAPFALDLRYLLTGYAPPDPQVGLADAQGLLAGAMRVLHEHPIVPAEYLEDGLATGDVKVTLEPTDVEELGAVWSALGEDFRLSAVYAVSCAPLPSSHEAAIPRRVERVAVDVEAGTRRPALTGVTPAAGPAGSTVVVAGRDLAGWHATVRIGGLVAADGRVDADDAVPATVPDLVPGLYELDADVARLVRLRRAFEVTA